MKAHREPHRYTMTPTWSVTLEGVDVLRCPKCGYFEVPIERPEALHRAIASAVIRKPTRLAGPELTFLRRELDLTGVQLARVLGVRNESVSRWERGREPIGPTVDRLMRALIALTTRQEEKFSVEVLSSIEGEAGPLRLIITKTADGDWKKRAA
jgi:putative zinc finger/helix-turn-helix YgiT family protein